MMRGRGRSVVEIMIEDGSNFAEMVLSSEWRCHEGPNSIRVVARSHPPCASRLDAKSASEGGWGGDDVRGVREEGRVEGACWRGGMPARSMCRRRAGRCRVARVCQASAHMCCHRRRRSTCARGPVGRRRDAGREEREGLADMDMVRRRCGRGSRRRGPGVGGGVERLGEGW